MTMKRILILQGNPDPDGHRYGHAQMKQQSLCRDTRAQRDGRVPAEHDRVIRADTKSVAIRCGLAAAMMLAASCGVASEAPRVAHLSGGVSAEERASITAQEADFNVKLVFTLVEGNYLADVTVAIRDASGTAVLTTQALGPIVLARLPKGKYVVAATHEGKAQTRNIEVRDRKVVEYLRWPSNPEKDFPGPKNSEREP